jgi:hypothetical protein
LAANWEFRNLIIYYLYAPVFFLVGLDRFFDNLPSKNSLRIAFFSIFIALSTAAGLINPRSQIFDNSGWLGILIPAIAFMPLAWLLRKNSANARRYSLLPYKPATYVIVGCFFGICAAIHFFLISRFLPNVQTIAGAIEFEYLVWLFGLLAGLIIPAEELLFRGVVFSKLFDDIGMPYLKTTLRISTMNLVAYMPIVVFLSTDIIHLPGILLALVYKFLLSIASIYMIYRWRNLYVSYIANLAFAFLLIQYFLQ